MVIDEVDGEPSIANVWAGLRGDCKDLFLPPTGKVTIDPRQAKARRQNKDDGEKCTASSIKQV